MAGLGPALSARRFALRCACHVHIPFFHFLFSRLFRRCLHSLFAFSFCSHSAFGSAVVSASLSFFLARTADCACFSVVSVSFFSCYDHSRPMSGCSCLPAVFAPQRWGLAPTLPLLLLPPLQLTPRTFPLVLPSLARYSVLFAHNFFFSASAVSVFASP